MIMEAEDHLRVYLFICLWSKNVKLLRIIVGAAGISQLIKISEKEYHDLLNDFDPIEAPPHNYKIQPQNQGILFH